MFKTLQNLCQIQNIRTLPAFSLLEVAFVILIVGVLSAAAMKGYDVLQSAKLTSSAQEIQRIQLAWMQYCERMGRNPNDPPWADLYAAHLLQSDQPPVLKIGGTLRVTTNPSNDMSGTWLVCEGAAGTPLLTPAQAQQLKQHMDEGSLAPDKGRVRLMGPNCVEAGQIKTTRDTGCIVYVELGS